LAKKWFSKLISKLSLYIFFGILALVNTKDLYACSNWWGWGLNGLVLLPTPFLGVCIGTDVASIDATVGAVLWLKADVGLNIGLFDFDKCHYSLSLRYAHEGVMGTEEKVASGLFRWKDRDSKKSYAIGYVFFHEKYAATTPFSLLTYTIGFDFW
jgi:hypothetical protein